MPGIIDKIHNSSCNWVHACLIFALILLLFLFIRSISNSGKESFDTISPNKKDKTQRSNITKIVIQTSREKPNEIILNNFKQVLSPGWQYKHFNDDEIIEFFKNNYLEEFPDVIAKFYSMPSGAHKADLFRYYYIYIHGGVFVDSDGVLETNTDNLVKDVDFFSVHSLVNAKSVFQGLIGAVPKNEIIYKALDNIYNIDIKALSQNYFLIVQNLYTIVHEKTYDFKIKLYEEHVVGKNKYATTVDPDNGEVILTHYFASKTVPPYQSHI